MTTPAQQRIAAIVGRPNVGKSSIFNRLAARRIAIVHEQSGVTRDRLIHEVNWSDERFELVDTGGVCNLDGEAQADRIEAGVRVQVDAALSDAPVAIFVVDITAGVLPLDLEVAGLLRNSGRAVVVAANKADSPSRDQDAGAFEELGFPVFPVSASHNRGFDPLMAAVLAGLPDVPNASIGNPLRVAVVGRPNVGKSSYINRLLKSERVIVSDVPGTTRDSISIPFTVGHGEQARHYLLIDTAGLRRAGKVTSAVEKYSHIRADASVASADVVVLMLDASQGPSAQDKRIAARTVDKCKGCVMIVNKWDLAKGVTERQYGSALLEAVPFMRHCPVVFTSATEGYNIRRTVDAIDHVAAQVCAELPTGLLNRTIIDAYERVAPPTIAGKPLKIFYAAQVGRQPVRIRVFVNDPHRAKPAYCAYLLKQLRDRFGLEGAPVLIDFRRRRPSRR